MRTLNKKQQKKLHKWFLKQRENKNTTIFNLTLTFDDEFLENTQKKKKNDYDPFIGESKRLMLRLARKLKVHLFGYIAKESLSLSRDTINEIVRPHFHILMAAKFDHIGYNITRDMISPLWKHSKPDQIIIQSWDGDKELINYNYGHTIGSDNFHEVLITTPFYPRRATCRNKTCETCNSYPSMSDILGK
tara:strand:+ start:822 stop:1391 length:570 start_codon:yes stop_codon:yes gene_type:complete